MFLYFGQFFYDLLRKLHIFGNKSSVDIIFHNRIIRSITPTRMKKNIHVVTWIHKYLWIVFTSWFASTNDVITSRGQKQWRPATNAFIWQQLTYMIETEYLYYKIIILNKTIADDRFETNLAMIWLITQLITKKTHLVAVKITRNVLNWSVD